MRVRMLAIWKIIFSKSIYLKTDNYFIIHNQTVHSTRQIIFECTNLIDKAYLKKEQDSAIQEVNKIINTK